MRRRLRTDVIGLGEGDIAVVLDDEPIETRRGIGARVRERSIIDRLDLGAPMIRRTWQRQKMHDADQHAVRSAENLL